jgi:serine/threonine protein kinase
MAGEVGALLNISHPNLLRILDANLKEDWFVCEYHPAGPLSNYPELFKGDIVGALKAFRPIVEGVAKLHQAGLIHRDIKPANVFLASGSRLVLGDMGLAFRDQQERATETYENVGSRDWMPPWAMGMRLQDVRPCFDVFSLGKLFWFMVSGKGILRLWYYDRPEFNLEVQFPDDERMRWVNRLLTGCIREEPQYCWQSATQLLEHIDKFLDILRRGGEILRGDIRRHCRVCGVGVYTMIVNERMGPSAIRNFGLQAVGDPRWRIFQCGFCGHIQMFQLNGSNPAAWQE